MLFAMANSGLPGTSGFVGEFLVIMGTMKVNFWYATTAATTLLFGAAYTLWMYKRVVFGAVANSHVEGLVEVDVFLVERVPEMIVGRGDDLVEGGRRATVPRRGPRAVGCGDVQPGLPEAHAASMKLSRVSLDSVSVGSIIMASFTISGK